MLDQQLWTLWGGGLANCLLALRLQEQNLPFCIIERQAELAGDHTWSFHEGDLDAVDLKFVEPFITQSWPGYMVKFKTYERHFSSRYFTIRSSDLRKVVHQRIPAEKIKLQTSTEPKAPSHSLIDARGFEQKNFKNSGWQKFVGWDVQFAKPHGVIKPIIMDASVEQIDGYRFLYVLPLDTHTLLVEDTRYSNSAEIIESSFENGLKQYIAKNWPGQPWSISRKERAALPIPLQVTAEPARFGVSGGFFHPVTGYSLPFAVKVSRKLLDLLALGHPLPKAWRILAARYSRNQSYYVQLNRMMFLAASPEQRWRIFDRFYRLNESLIERFYAGHSTTWDKLRILSGKPPVPVGAAMRALFNRREEPAWN